MEALKRKWNSRRGASILLALLFLLVCMMVGASVVMAADSNAGKLRSNKEEQQRYLTLSSALTLLCDKLQSVEYVGKYDYEYVEDTNPDVAYDTGYETYHHEHNYTQKKGELRLSGGGSTWTLNEVLPLYRNLDNIFFTEKFSGPNRREYVSSVDNGAVYNDYNYKKGTEVKLSTDPYKLKFTVKDVDGLSETVSITANLLQTDGRIVLTATMEGHPLKVEATLKPSDDDLIGKFSLKEHSEFTSLKTYETEPVTWTLEQIVRRGG